MDGTLFPDTQAWLNNSLSLKINNRFNLKFTNETRYNQITFMDPYLKNWQGGVVYNLPKQFYVAFLYKRENSEQVDVVLSENRFTLEGGWNKKVSRAVDFNCRFRTEIRRYQYGLAENHLRFRFRLGFKMELKIGNLTMRPFIATEPFADTISDRIFRNRFYIGTAFPLGKKVEWIVNYIREDARKKETIHILNSGLNLKF
jgi:hypothetical protein